MVHRIKLYLERGLSLNIEIMMPQSSRKLKLLLHNTTILVDNVKCFNVDELLGCERLRAQSHSLTNNNGTFRRLSGYGKQ